MTVYQAKQIVLFISDFDLAIQRKPEVVLFTIVFYFSLVYNRQQPDSRGSTPTLDNGKYDSTSAIPTVGSAMYSIPRGEGVYSSESHPQSLPALPAPSRQRCKDYDGNIFCLRFVCYMLG